MQTLRAFPILSIFTLVASLASAQPPRARARDLGVPFEGTPGPLNAITDVAGVEVGFATLISRDGPLDVGKGPIRTGVTAILPRGKTSNDPVMAGWYSLNGNGEMTGTTWIKESGFLEGPVFITNTHSVGTVRDASIAWALKHGATHQPWSLPVVAETWDGALNDINGFHVKPDHVFQALDAAKGGPVAEGNVGGGTGMICYQFKCGTGTASRRLDAQAGGYTVGVLVQSNYGGVLTMGGAPIGKLLGRYSYQPRPSQQQEDHGDGSCMIVVATDAPLDARDLKRVAARAVYGLARTGSSFSNGSGEFAIAFSTAADLRTRFGATAVQTRTLLPTDGVSPLFQATLEATEEAVYNSLLKATAVSSRYGKAEALPVDRLKEILGRYPKN